MTLEILTIPHPALRRPAAVVTDFSPALQQLAREMIETMTTAGGSGLAAPQVGVAKRLFVMRLRGSERRLAADHPLRGQNLVVVNPEVFAVSDEMAEGIEGCLSIPGYAGLVPRHRAIVLQGRNAWGEPCRYAVEGYAARVMLHEVDHLDGILFLDRLDGDDKLYRMTERVPDDDMAVDRG